MLVLVDGFQVPLPGMNGIDWGMTLLLAVSKISDQGRQLSPTVDALKWSGIKEYLDSPLSTDRIEEKSGCAIHHNVTITILF